ncbi:MAG: HDOD domain-containing protein [Opitutales bacterium]
MKIHIFDVAANGHSLADSLRGLSFDGHASSAFEAEVFDATSALFEAFEHDPEAALLVDAEQGKEVLDVLGEVSHRWPHTLRLACATTTEMRRLRDLTGWVNQILFKPLDANRFVRRIELAAQLKPLLTDPSVFAIIAGSKSLPSFLDSYGQLLEALDSPEADLLDIGEAIEQDVGLSSTVLSLANSAFFGGGTEVTGAAHAISKLGLSAVRAVVMAYPALSLLDKSPHLQKQRKTFWKHSRKVAEVARFLARTEGFGHEVVGYAYSAGLLHDVGKLILASNFGKQYDAYLDYAAAQDVPLHTVERSSMGTDHAAIGAFMLGVWGVPQPIVEGIWKHHEAPSDNTSTFDVPYLIYGANALVRHLDAAGQGTRPPVPVPFVSQEAIPESVRAQIENWLETWRTSEADALQRKTTA